MNRRRYMGWLGSALVVAGALGCNADEEPAGLLDAGGGSGGGAGHAGSAGTAGASGSVSTAGGGGNGGSAVADAGPDQSVGPDARSEAAAETGLETGSSNEASTDAGDAGSKSYALAVGSDFVTGGVKLVAVNWSTKQIAGSTVFPNVKFSDAIPTASAGRGFMIERSDSKLVIVQKDQPWLASKTVDLAIASPDGGSDPTNPVAVVNTGAKAYVPLYFKNRIAIVDVDNGAVTGNVDLSAFVDAADSDGLVDVFDGVYDSAVHRAYFLLANIPQLEKGIEPDRTAVCIAVGPSIIAVDTTNDQIVDLNGDAGGKGFTLLGRNPTSFVPDLANGRVLVVDAGCYQLEGGGVPDGGAAQAAIPRVGRGIEAINLTTGASSWLYTHGEATRLSGLVMVDATHAFISGDDAFYTTHWYPWDPSNGATHDVETLTMPQFSPHYVGGNLVVGLSPTYVDGGTLNAFVAFNVGTSAVATLVPNIFGDAIYTGQYNGWALLP